MLSLDTTTPILDHSSILGPQELASVQGPWIVISENFFFLLTQSL